MSKTMPQPPKQSQTLLGRKFTPLSGAIRKRKKPLELNPLPADLIPQPPTDSQKSARGSSRKTTARAKQDELVVEAKVSKESVCEELLLHGNPQSYIDFYYLTHGQFDAGFLSEENLSHLQAKLTNAEVSLRSGDPEDSILTYTDLGEMFMNRSEYRCAGYFFERCLEVSRLNDLYEYEALAFKGIGDTFFNQGDIFGSMQEYEDGLKIAETYDVKNATISISAQLLDLYRIVADSLEEDNRLEEALNFHEKTLAMCQMAQDKAAEGTACYRIGLVHFNNQDYKKALTYQKKYRNLSAEVDNKEGVTTSLAAIASTYQAMESISLAIETLEELRTVSEESQNIAAQAGAALNLGLLYHQQGSNNQSVTNLQKHYQLARNLGDRGLVDAARVNLGVAEANCTVDEYVDVVSDNLPGLLLWKNKRGKWR